MCAVCDDELEGAIVLAALAGYFRRPRAPIAPTTRCLPLEATLATLRSTRLVTPRFLERSWFIRFMHLIESGLDLLIIYWRFQPTDSRAHRGVATQLY